MKIGDKIEHDGKNYVMVPEEGGEGCCDGCAFFLEEGCSRVRGDASPLDCEGILKLMNTFKVGDKVRRINNRLTWFSGSLEVGETATVVKVIGSEEPDSGWLVLDCMGSEGGAGNPEYFELVEAAPWTPKNGEEVEVLLKDGRWHKRVFACVDGGNGLQVFRTKRFGHYEGVGREDVRQIPTKNPRLTEAEALAAHLQEELDNLKNKLQELLDRIERVS